MTRGEPGRWVVLDENGGDLYEWRGQWDVRTRPWLLEAALKPFSAKWSRP